MLLRQRTLKRLALLLAIIVPLLAAVALWRAQLRQAHAAEIMHSRATGLQAYERGDWATAELNLGRYLSEGVGDKVRADVRARLAHAEVTARLPGASRGPAAASRLLAALANDAAELGLVEHRLTLFHASLCAASASEDWPAVVALATETLAAHPDDLVALRFRRDALSQLSEPAAALQAARRVTALQPTSFLDQVRLLRLMEAAGSTPSDLVRHATALVDEARSAGGADPRLLLLLAVAYDHAGQYRQASACLDQAAAALGVGGSTSTTRVGDPWSEPASPDQAERSLSRDDRIATIIRLSQLYDGLNRYDRARVVLEDAVSQLPDVPRLRAEAAVRRWHAGDVETARALLGEIEPSDLTSSPTLLGLWATLPDASPDEADIAVRTLRQIGAVEGTDQPRRRAALAWADALAAKAAPTAVAVDLLRRGLARIETAPGSAALPREPTAATYTVPHGLLLAAIAERFEQMREAETALSHWRAAANAETAWHQPWSRIARLQLDAGQLSEAASAADEASRRAEFDLSPQEVDGPREQAAILLTQVAYRRWLAAPSPSGADQAAALAAEHQQRRPMHPATLPIHVHLTALTNKAEAVELIEQAMVDGASPALRVALAEASRAAELGLENRLLEGLQTPAALALRAEMLAEQDRIGAGATLLQTATETAKTAQAKLDYSLALARWLEKYADETQAAAGWKQLATAFPDEIDAQIAVLEEGDSLRRRPEDRPVLVEAVRQLRELTGGEQGYGRRWRLHEARLMLDRAVEPVPTDDAGAPSAQQAVLEAAEMLRGLIAADPNSRSSIEARLLLADALWLGGNAEAAVDHLQAAWVLDPARGDTGLRLISLLERLGRHDRAARVLGQLAAEGVRADATSGDVLRERLEVAQRLSEAGDAEAALSLLSQVDAAGDLGIDGRLLQADLLTRIGEEAEANRVYEQLLATDPVPPTEALLAAAVFKGTHGDPAAAAALINRLEETSLSETEQAIVRATYHARIGEGDEARRWFDAALASRPGHASPWREAAAFELARNRPSQALDLIERAATVSPDVLSDDRIALLRVEAEVALAHDDVAAIGRLAALRGRLSPTRLGGSATLLDAIAQAATKLQNEGRASLSPADLGALETAARRLTSLTRLHRLLIELYSERGDNEQAARVARRAASAAPANPEFQRLAYTATRLTGRAQEALHYARQWRRTMRSGQDAVWADTAIADALMLQGQYDAAAQLLRPHLKKAMAKPAEYGHLLGLAAEAMAAVGDHALAFEIVAPWLHRDDDTGESWRITAARLAAVRINDPAEATRWLQTIDNQRQRLPTGGRVVERLELAGAWGRLGVHFDDPAALHEARRRLQDLLDGPLRGSTTPDSVELAARAWEVLARIETALGDGAAAEAAWRRVLTLNTTNALAANELAFLLLSRPAGSEGSSSEGSMIDRQSMAGSASRLNPTPARAAESLSWARLAVRESPQVAAYYDTLARALLALEREEEAQQAFERALRLDERQLDAMLGLATLLLEQARTSDAATAPASPSGEDPATRATTRADIDAKRLRAQRLFERLEPLYRATFALPSTVRSGNQLPAAGWQVQVGPAPHLKAEFAALSAAFDPA